MEKILLGTERMVSRASSNLSVTQNTHTFNAGVVKKMLKKADQAPILWEELYPSIPIPPLLHCRVIKIKI